MRANRNLSKINAIMLEKPDLSEEKICASLQEDYGLRAVQVAFIPLGADSNAAVYRIVAGDGRPYFLKLRSGVFNETSVTLPKHLSDLGIQQIIAPLRTKTGGLWTGLERFTAILYPYIEGRNGFEVVLSERQWGEFGAALKRVHRAGLPHALSGRLRREAFSPRWRESLMTSLKRVEQEEFVDPVAVKLAALMKARRAEILDLAGRAEARAQALQARPGEFVLCHSDVHAGNLLIDANGALYIVDWDDAILAPKERDLMYIGGAQGFAGYTPEEEETLFYRGYGQTEIDRDALAYYRYERIVEDMAIYCEELFSTSAGGEDRQQSFTYFASNFLPNGTIEIAYRSDQTLTGIQARRVLKKGPGLPASVPPAEDAS